MTTAIHRMVDACRRGDPAVIARLPSGWAVMGQRQVLRGYSLLLPDPVVPHLNALEPNARDCYLADLGRLGDAVLAATSALRVNYAIFGNVEPALHAHVHPRFADEPEPYRRDNPWRYDWSAAPVFDVSVHGPLRDEIRARLAAEPLPGGTLHHLDLSVGSMAASTAFYDRWLPAMGFVRIADCADGPLWRGAQFELGLQQARNTAAHDRYSRGLHHLAFTAPSRAAVEDLHRQLRSAGVSVLDAPADYPEYGPGYFAVFFADPDGIKLEYVHTPP